MLKRLLSFQKLYRLKLLNRELCTLFVPMVQNSQIHKRNLKQVNVFSLNYTTSNVQERKRFPFIENNFAFSIITKFPILKGLTSVGREIKTEEDFNKFTNKNWRQSSATEIVTAFLKLQAFCTENNITLEDARFDNLVDGLLDHCEKLSYDEIRALMDCLTQLPPTHGYQAHNFHDVWSCLDDICCWKMAEWDIDCQFCIANLWYKLNMGRLCDYTYVLIDRLSKKADRLTKEQLVNVLFYFNTCRKRAVDFEYEYALSKCIDKLTVDQMAVIAMGYFKTKTKIKVVPILEAIVKKVTENSKTIHEISLAAILKVIRFSKPATIIPEVNAMLDQLTLEIPRLSELCCLHIGLIGTSAQTYHSKSLQQVSEKLIKCITDIEKVRLKDIERILNVLSMFDFDPKTKPDFFKAAFNELHREERRMELIKYFRCLPCSLNYLSIRNIYSYELMDRILLDEYIIEKYGKTVKMMPRELLILDCSIDIECPGYKGNRLLPYRRYKAAKWLTDFAPSYDQYKKINATDQLFLDIVDRVENIVENKKLLLIDHVLPHFPRPDIIVCKDKIRGKFIEPPGFENFILGDVKFPHKDPNLEWYAIVVVSWNNTLKDSSIPLGSMLMKKRQLTKVGYKPVLVIWREFLNLPRQAQLEYISRQLT